MHTHNVVNVGTDGSQSVGTDGSQSVGTDGPPNEGTDGSEIDTDGAVSVISSLTTLLMATLFTVLVLA